MIEFAPKAVPVIIARAPKPVLVRTSVEAAETLDIREATAPVVAVESPPLQLLVLSSEDPAPRAVKRRGGSQRKTKDAAKTGGVEDDSVAPLLLNLEV